MHLKKCGEMRKKFYLRHLLCALIFKEVYGANKKARQFKHTSCGIIKLFGACLCVNCIIGLMVVQISFDQDVFADPFYGNVIYPVCLFKSSE